MVKAQKYINKNYSTKEKKEEIKDLNINKLNLEGELDLSDFINLERLNCRDNKITSLKFTGLKNLCYIDACYNLLTNLEDIASLENPEKLEKLKLTDNNFPQQDLSVFSKFTNLEKLRIGNYYRETKENIYNRFTGSLEPLKNLTKLEDLEIGWTDVDSGLEHLSESLVTFWCYGGLWEGYGTPENKSKKFNEELKDFHSGNRGKHDLTAYWNEVKTILLIGRTGNGKSTLANVIVGYNKFGESAGSVSKTKKVQIEKFKHEFETEEGEKKKVVYRIVDTVGVGDTSMTLDKVLRKLALMGYSVKDGLSQILFVTDGQLAKEAKSTYDLLEKIVFDENVAKYTTVIRTNFPNFKNEDEYEKERKIMIKNSEEFKELIEKCNKIIYVDNPPINITGFEKLGILNGKTREESRKILISHLNSVCQDDIYKPNNLINLGNAIGEYMEKKEELKESKEDSSEEKTKENKSFFEDMQSILKEKLKNLKDINDNKTLNDEITKKMLEHIGNIDPKLKKDIKTKLEKLKGKKESKWNWFGKKHEGIDVQSKEKKKKDVQGEQLAQIQDASSSKK